jgi:succinyl-CoA synthetase beta subunit
MERDGEVVELAPLILSKDNQLIVTHAKIKIDESSLYR